MGSAPGGGERSGDRCGTAEGRKLTDVFSNELAGLELEAIGEALADTVASTYPVGSASSSVGFVYNPKLETFERQTRVLGPILGERAETIGGGEMDVALTYSYVHPTRINGQDLDDLMNAPTVGGRVVSFPVPGGVTLADGRFTNFLPVQVLADLDVVANIITPGVTYGLTPNLDVNFTLPLIQTDLDIDVTDTVPDPRLPQFALPALPNGQPNIVTRTRSFSESAFGVGDALIRLKYVFSRGEPLDLGAGLGLSLPSGDEENLHGTGDTHLTPTLIASRVFAERIEPLLNLGFDINANDVDASSFRWAVGATAQIFGPLTGALVFLGRNEFGEQTEPIDAPFFFQIERNDIYDVAIGLRYLFLESFILSANVLVPLNDDGLRADAVPTAQLEYLFSVPR
jgi:hypothetical protein